MNILTLIGVGFVIGIIAGVAAHEFVRGHLNTQISKMQKPLTVPTSSTLAQQIASAKSNLTALQAQTAMAETGLAALQAQAATVDDLAQQIASAKSKLTALQAQTNRMVTQQERLSKGLQYLRLEIRRTFIAFPLHSCRELQSLDPTVSTHSDALQQTLDIVLMALSPRQRQVLVWRYGLADDASPMTLVEISAKLNLSRERVRQIELRAMKILRHPSRSRFLRDYLDVA